VGGSPLSSVVAVLLCPVLLLPNLLDDLAVESVMPPSVTRQASRPSRTQRVTVFGDTPSSLATSDRVRN